MPSVKNDFNIPKNDFNIPAASKSALRSRRRRGVFMLGPLSFAWAALMTILYCQATVSSVYNFDNQAVSRHTTFVWVLLLGSLVFVLFQMLVRKSFRRAVLARSSLAGMALSLIMGWLVGNVMFSQSYVQEMSQSALATTEGFKYMASHIVLPSHEDEKIRQHWYDPTGHLWPDKQESWCSNAQANLNAFIGQNINAHSRAAALSAVLAQSQLAHLHANDCLTDEQFIEQSHALSDRASAGSKSYEVIQRLGYFAPILQLVGQAEPQLLERTRLSPQKACLTLVEENQQQVCQAYPSDRRIGVEEFRQLKQALSSKE